MLHVVDAVLDRDLREGDAGGGGFAGGEHAGEVQRGVAVLQVELVHGGGEFAAMVLVINMGVAFCMVHKEQLGAGEMAFLYLGVFVTLFFTGGGTFSLDKVLFGKGGKGASVAKKG